MYASSSSSSADGAKYVGTTRTVASKYGSYVLELNSPPNDRRSRTYQSTSRTVPRQSPRGSDINGNVRSLSLSKSLSPSYTTGSLARDTKTLSLGNTADKRYDTKKRLDAYYANRSPSAYLNKPYNYRASNLSYFEKYNKQQQQDSQTSNDLHHGHHLQPSSLASSKYVNMNKKYADNAPATATDPYGSRQSTDAKKGVVGIRNIGNTCYMNSVLQCLSNTKALTDSVLADAAADGKLIRVYRDLLSRVWSAGHDGAPVDTTAFKSAFQRLSPRFVGYEQQDSQEFLRLLLEKLHVDVNRVRAKPRAMPDADDTLKDNALAADFWRRYLATDNSTVVDLFAGQLKSTLECSECGHKSITFEVGIDPVAPHIFKRCIPLAARPRAAGANYISTRRAL